MKKISLNILILLLTPYSVSTASNELPPAPPGVIMSPYEACQEVIIVSEEKYEDHKKDWKSWETTCGKEVQLSLDAGITKLKKLDDATKYLDLTHKVSKKIIENLDKSRGYAECSASCFSGAKNCTSNLSQNDTIVQCDERKAEIQKAMRIKASQIRMELALSNDAPGLVEVNVLNALAVKDEKFINSNLRDFEMATPNPVGRTDLTPREYKEAKRRFVQEKKKLEDEFKENGYTNYNHWMSTKLIENMDKHREKYRSLIYEEAPIFAVIDRPKEFNKKNDPVWTDAQLAEGFKALSKNADETKRTIEKTLEKGKLEFSRLKGEALAKWLTQLIPGTKDQNDLLYYMALKNQVEEVLKEEPNLCGIATTLHQRLMSRELQNTGVVLVASFAGGAGTKVVSKGVSNLFRIGRSLTGSEASGLTGLAIGSVFLGDSFRLYNSYEREITSGVREAKSLQDARTNIALNVGLAPLLAPAGYQFKNILYNSLGNKMSKDLPEISDLMKQAGTNQDAKDKAINSWMLLKVKEAVKKKTLTEDEVLALKSESSSEIMNQLAIDINKNGPEFFNDPANFDIFLKAAATSIKKVPGDPEDLGENSRKLFLSLNVDAFQSWDPNAKKGLMKVFEQGVEELRLSYINDPAAYAKFRTDPEAHEKIMMRALKKSGVVDDSTLNAMKTCALR